MPLCDYFSAPDDQAAVAALQIPGGPGQAERDVVFLQNIDPVVAIARLEAVMTGCSYEEATRDPGPADCCPSRRTARRSWSA
ncbi:hypothetical protein [Streptomyces sp. NPDC007988]|uniref:hypothetical protein n=1 Tax=Streptomyces sp. NPDC007988 TaxID=3364802 RepID=UPI0036EBCE44